MRIILAFILCISFGSFSQESKDIGSIKLRNKTIYQRVLGNLLSKITYERVSNLDMSKNILEKDFSEHLLDTSMFYKLWFNPLINDSITNYNLYVYSGFPQFYINLDSTYLIGKTPNFRYYDPLMSKGIIGLDKGTNYLIFVSGYMFLDDIKPLLPLTNETEVKTYIRLKYFNYSPQTVVIYKELSDKSTNWTASFYSETNKKKYLIKIPITGSDTLEELKKPLN